MADANDALSESLEDYLEAILALEKKHKVARVKDIAAQMDVLRGTVTGALKSLGEKGFINYAPYSFITLTPKGAAIAREVTRRHTILKSFFHKVLQIDRKKANAIACRMEHAMDRASIEKLVQFVDFVDTCPRAGIDLIETYLTQCAGSKGREANCKVCLQTFQPDQ